ncbi:MAG TPA: hypothetical protein VF263_07660 [Longimicrobiaceae bacterium]
MRQAVSFTCAVLALAVAGSARAQETPASILAPEASRPAADPLLAYTAAGNDLLAPSPAAAPVSTAPRATRAARVSRTRSLLHTVGGVLVGAGVGYFTSAVVRSDWDKDSNREVASHRTSFALGGAVFGGAGGLLIGTRAPVMSTGLRPATRVAENAITADQIDAVGVANIYDVVMALRPEWLRIRGINSMTEGDRVVASAESPEPLVIPGAVTIQVYLENGRMGGVEALRQIPVSQAGEVRFLNAQQATYKWGIGHAHGAIWVTGRK